MASKIIVDQLEKSGFTTLTLPSANATANQYIKNDGAGALSWATLPAGGKVLHIEQVVKTDTTSTTAVGASVVDMPGMTVTMPASVATSRYLIFWNLSLGGVANDSFYLVLVREVSGVEVQPLLGDTAGSRIRTSLSATPAYGAGTGVSALQYLDSPATTNAVTYKIKWSNQYAGTHYLNRSTTDLDSGLYQRSTSSITVMEIGV
jgi:hypothetical protein